MYSAGYLPRNFPASFRCWESTERPSCRPAEIISSYTHLQQRCEHTRSLRCYSLRLPLNAMAGCQYHAVPSVRLWEWPGMYSVLTGVCSVGIRSLRPKMHGARFGYKSFSNIRLVGRPLDCHRYFWYTCITFRWQTAISPSCPSHPSGPMRVLFVSYRYSLVQGTRTSSTAD